MPAKHYQVLLDASQRDYLLGLISSETAAARKLTRARILLKADESEQGPAYTDAQIQIALDASLSTIQRVRKAFVQKGLPSAVVPKKRSNATRPRKFDGEKEAHLIALACSEAPEGFSNWTLRVLAEKMVELEHFSSISPETIRQVLKKTGSNRG